MYFMSLDTLYADSTATLKDCWWNISLPSNMKLSLKVNTNYNVLQIVHVQCTGKWQ